MKIKISKDEDNERLILSIFNGAIYIFIMIISLLLPVELFIKIASVFICVILGTATIQVILEKR